MSMKLSKSTNQFIFPTASFHIVKPCNMACKFCYATFQDMRVQSQLSLKSAITILTKLKDAGLEKITFAGGEPLLYKPLPELIKASKQLGLTTSIITNGSLLNESFLFNMSNDLDWIGLSIDSLSLETNQKIGRISKGQTLDYFKLVDLINSYGYKIKINTVVNKYNQHEIMSGFIDYTLTTRWKVFDTLRVEGQNDKQFDEIKSTDFNLFIMNNLHDSMVVESNDLMTGSYLLIDPLGRLFENSSGKHTYSLSLINNTVEKCLKDLNLSKEKFLQRGGIYKW